MPKIVVEYELADHSGKEEATDDECRGCSHQTMTGLCSIFNKTVHGRRLQQCRDAQMLHKLSCDYQALAVHLTKKVDDINRQMAVDRILGRGKHAQPHRHHFTPCGDGVHKRCLGCGYETLIT